MDPYVLAVPVNLCLTSGSPPQVDIVINVLGVDTTGVPIVFDTTYCFDNSLPVATNVANIKAAIVADAVLFSNVKLLTTNITLLMAAN